MSGDFLKPVSAETEALLRNRGGRELFSDAEYSVIIAKRLYGARPQLAWLRERAYAHLAPKRVPHVQGAEQEAVRLAQRWGEDEGDAAEAAILHDITKNLPGDEQRRLCDEYHLAVDEVERASEKLLHSKTGAALSRELFGIPDHIYRAIDCHTTGAPDMTTLEKILYIADYIEPTRSGFEGLEELRRLAYTDLDACMELGLRLSLAEVTAKGYQPHRRTVEACAYYAALNANKLTKG